MLIAKVLVDDDGVKTLDAISMKLKPSWKKILDTAEPYHGPNKKDVEKIYGTVDTRQLIKDEIEKYNGAIIFSGECPDDYIDWYVSILNSITR